MTEQGKSFVEHFELAKQIAAANGNVFVALSIAFDDKDWYIAFAAIGTMAEDIKRIDLKN